MKTWCMIVAVLLAAFVSTLWPLICLLGLGRVTFDHTPGPCHLVSDDQSSPIDHLMTGSEDIVVFEDGTALITSGMRFNHEMLAKFPDRVGQIFMFNFSHPERGAKLVTLSGGDLSGFNPHGIASFTDFLYGETTVWIVSHPPGLGHDIIEKFQWDAPAMTLRHIASITHPLFRLTNDLVAVDSDSFYITNYFWSRFESHLQRKLETLTSRPWGQVLFYDGSTDSAQVMAEGLLGPNGVALSADKNQLYVAECHAQNLLIYTRNGDNSLTVSQVVSVATAIDNLIVDEAGDIWTGAHPVIWRFTKHADDPAIPAPSQVLRIQVSNVGSVAVEEVFSDSGRLLYGSSVAAHWKKGLLIGTVQHKLMYCSIKHQGLPSL